MKKLLVVALSVAIAGGCSGGSSSTGVVTNGIPPVRTPSTSGLPNHFPRVDPVKDVSSDVTEQLDNGTRTVEEIAPGIYRRADGVLLGKCSGVEPYIAAHSYTGGEICSNDGGDTTASATTTTTTSPVGTGADYLRIVKPVVTTEAAAKALPNDPSVSDLEKVLDPVATAIQTFDTRMLAITWPASAESDVKMLVTLDGASVNDLQSLHDQSVLGLSSWETQLGSDFGKSTAESQIVRHDLGLPPAPTS